MAPSCASEASQHLCPLRPSSPLASQAPNHLLKSGQHFLETDGRSAFLSYPSQTSDGASKGAYEGGQVAGGEAQAEHF